MSVDLPAVGFHLRRVSSDQFYSMYLEMRDVTSSMRMMDSLIHLSAFWRMAYDTEGRKASKLSDLLKADQTYERRFEIGLRWKAHPEVTKIAPF